MNMQEIDKKSMRMKVLLFAALVLFLFFSQTASALFLKCNKHIFQLNLKNHTAKFVSVDSNITGKLETRDNLYILRFPKTKERWETWVKINRYSGEMEWEHGSKPFFTGNSNNVFFSGVCKIINIQKL
jgi:hypothetical protein